MEEIHAPIPAAKELFDLSHTVAKELFENADNVYDVLSGIGDFAKKLGEKLEKEGTHKQIAPMVWVAEGVKIAEFSTVIGPTVIGKGTEIRPGAYIRGNAIIGEGAVIGNSTEIKNAIIFDGAQLPHYNYVGDSVIGHRAHLGAGAIISNFRLDHSSIKIRVGDEKIDTGLRKMGAMIGDFTEIGCGSVISPGSIIGKGCMLYPLTSFVGILDEGTRYKKDR